MKKNMIRIITITVGICLLISISFLSFIIIKAKISENQDFTPNLIVNQTSGRINDDFNFQVKDVKHDANITWDFGDGNSTYGNNVIHQYKYSDHFNIMCIILQDGIKKKTNITISVKNLDAYYKRSGNSLRDLTPITSKEADQWVFVFHGVSSPLIFLNVTAENLIGSATISFFTLKSDSKEQPDYFSIKSFTETGGNIEYKGVFRSDDFGDFDEYIICGAELKLENGRCGQYLIETSTLY